MDETDIQFQPENFTWEIKGSKEVIMKFIKYNKKTKTVVASITSFGHFIPFFVIGDTKSYKKKKKR